MKKRIKRAISNNHLSCHYNNYLYVLRKSDIIINNIEIPAIYLNDEIEYNKNYYVLEEDCNNEDLPKRITMKETLISLTMVY